MLNVGNVFNLSTWVVFGAVAIFLSIRFKENKAQWFSGFGGAIVVGAIDALVVFRLAAASHSSTGGSIVAALAPFIGLQTALIFFPLIWGLSGLLIGIARRPALNVWLTNSAVFLLAAAWVAFHQVQGVQRAKVSVRDAELLRKEFAEHRLSTDQKITLIGNGYTPLDVLMTMVEQETEERVQEALAERWNLPEASLRRLSDSRFERVYCKVASHYSSPEPLLIQIHQRHPGECDYALALNPKAPPEMLAALADSPTSYVRWAVSANPQTPRAVLLRLFEHREPEQTYWFLRNPNLPDDLRTALSSK